MTEVIQDSREEEDWENEDTIDEFSTARELRRLRDMNSEVARILTSTALPAAAFGVKFLAKLFGDLTLSKSTFSKPRFFLKENS